MKKIYLVIDQSYGMNCPANAHETKESAEETIKFFMENEYLKDGKYEIREINFYNE